MLRFFKKPLCLAWLSFIALTIVASPAAAQLPLMGEQSAFNLEQERQIGLQFYRTLLKRDLIESHPLIDGYINDLGDHLLGGLDNSTREYRFFVVRDDAINAFAVPGGFIGINRGLILRASTIDQVASVVAHEIAHVELRHGMQMMEKSREVGSRTTMGMLAGLLLGVANPAVGAATLYGSAAAGQQEIINYTRENEYEADRIGVGLMQSAGFQAQGMVDFFQIMQSMSQTGGFASIEYLRTHPLDTNRIAEAQGRVSASTAPPNNLQDFELFQAYLRHTSPADNAAPEGRYATALWQQRNGNSAEALQTIESLFRANPENLWYSAVYADLLEQLLRFEEASAVYQQLLVIYPEHYYVSLRMIRALQQLNKFEEALLLARVQERLRPQNRTLLFELSSIYDALGRTWLSKFSQAEFQRLSGNDRQAVQLYDEILRAGQADQATESRAREQRTLLTEQPG